MQVINRPHLDGTIMALLAVTLLLALSLITVSAARNVYDAQTREIERALRHLSAAP
ncbi:hypothetical protein [Methylobacterium nigriterrae]|uniref:hypothetical protein n=1 Tax=Methylobacterium nigriterrae TaxID=3127512 RepID=UPI0030138173